MKDTFVRNKALAASVSDEAVQQVEAAFNRSPRKSVQKGRRMLQMPKTTVWQVLHRRVRMKPYSAMLQNRWIGRAGTADKEWMKWPPPHSPDLTPCDYFLWGYVKEQVFVPTVPLDIGELKLNYRSHQENWQEHVRKSMGWAGLETGHLSGHKWSSYWASLGYAKLSEFIIRMALGTTV